MPFNTFGPLLTSFGNFFLTSFLSTRPFDPLGGTDLECISVTSSDDVKCVLVTSNVQSTLDVMILWKLLKTLDQ